MGLQGKELVPVKLWSLERLSSGYASLGKLYCDLLGYFLLVMVLWVRVLVLLFHSTLPSAAADDSCTN